MKIGGLLFALLLIATSHDVISYVHPFPGTTTTRNLVAPLTSSHFRESFLPVRSLGKKPTLKFKSNNNGKTRLNAIAESAEKNVKDDELLPASIIVGTITALMGFSYGKALAFSQKTLWTTFPNLLLQKLGALNPAYFITGMMTAGGLILGLLSSKLSTTFTVYDFVSAYSAAPVEVLPSSGIHLVPLLLLSLLTSAFGFSLGPEAPMVCAGALVGASLARKFYSKSVDNAEDMIRIQETLTYAGAAGSLTAFMGIPIAGSIFALEMTRSNAGLSKAGSRALSPAILSSIAALAVIRGIVIPNKSVGGHFTYGAIGSLSGRATIATSIACGVGGALLGTFFHKLVKFLKKIAWPKSVLKDKKLYARHNVLIKTLVGLLVGILCTNYPQTLFWGEGSLQTVIDGQQTAFSATKHGLSNMLTGAAKVDPNLPFQSAFAAAQVGIVKIVSIALACAGKFPGGIIFPLFFAAAPLAHAFAPFIGSNILPVAVMCLMASTQASVTRTPFATALILSLMASSTTELSLMLPSLLLASYLGVYVSRKLSSKTYFWYRE